MTDAVQTQNRNQAHRRGKTNGTALIGAGFAKFRRIPHLADTAVHQTGNPAALLHPGTRLPPSRWLAADLKVFRSVVVEAYAQLAAEGYLEAARGAGTRVRGHLSREAVVPVLLDEGPVPPMRWDLRPGSHNAPGLPRRERLTAYQRALSAPHPRGTTYPYLAGEPELRCELARHLGRLRGVAATPTGVLVVIRIRPGPVPAVRRAPGDGHHRTGGGGPLPPRPAPLRTGQRTARGPGAGRRRGHRRRRPRRDLRPGRPRHPGAPVPHRSRALGRPARGTRALGTGRRRLDRGGRLRRRALVRRPRPAAPGTATPGPRAGRLRRYRQQAPRPRTAAGLAHGTRGHSSTACCTSAPATTWAPSRSPSSPWRNCCAADCSPVPASARWPPG
ncbi:hypothetical protein STENM327S_02468 [Streptomyces tendae]